MSKSGQNANAQSAEQAPSRACDYVMQVRCIANKGCQRDNFFYELNQSFTTRVRVTDEIWEKHIRPVEEKEGRRLSDLEICELATPDFLEILGEGRQDALPPSIADQVQNPPKPGQDRAIRKPLYGRIRDAVQTLDHAKDHHWTEERKPAPIVVSSLVGQPVNADQIASAAPGMERRSL